ncbi:hypothetical protein [Paenibacillus sp. J2TS4]|nr:hypothetical protein [Paenibacillus sp. J2TS4]
MQWFGPIRHPGDESTAKVQQNQLISGYFRQKRKIACIFAANP